MLDWQREKGIEEKKMTNPHGKYFKLSSLLQFMVKGSLRSENLLF